MPGIVISTLTLLLIAGGSFLHGVTPQKITKGAEYDCSSFDTPTLIAKSAFVYDIKTSQTIFEKNADAQMPLASLTKIMTVLVASRTLPAHSEVVIEPEALTPEGDSEFTIGEVWRLQDLIDFTLITSSNDGAHALGLATSRYKKETANDFVARMNALAHTMGLTQTYFLNDTGLDVSKTLAGAYGSARDTALLLAEISQKDEAVYSQSTSAEKTFVTPTGKTYHAEHTSSITGTVPGEIASKTGFTDLAGGNLSLIVEPVVGHPVALVVLGSTRDGRNSDILTLNEYAKKTLKRATLCKK
ncbi:MAG: serine hydrolase [Patescibacteria group bacterium]